MNVSESENLEWFSDKLFLNLGNFREIRYVCISYLVSIFWWKEGRKLLDIDKAEEF